MKTRTKTNPNPLPAALLAGRGTAGKTPPTGIQHCKNPLQPAALLAGWSIVRKPKQRERKTPSSRPQAINGIPKGLAPLAPPAQGRPPRRRGVQGQSPGAGTRSSTPVRRRTGGSCVKEVHCPVRPSGGKSIPFEQEPRLTCISRTLPESPPPWTLHSHDDLCELVLICEGEADYSISGQEHHVRRGDLIIYNSGVVHDERSGTSMPVSSYCCSMTGLKLHGLRENAFLPDGACPVFPSGAHFEALRDTLSIMFDALSAGADGCAPFCNYLLLGVLSRVWALRHRQPAAPGAAQNLLGSRIKAYIDLHYTEDIRLQTLADGLHISPYYLSHVFKDMTGYSPGQYITRRRIGLAQNLLISTSLPVSEIAARVGYPSPSHFNDRFAKNVGMSPRAYRKAYLVPTAPQESASPSSEAPEKPEKAAKRKARTQ